MSTPSFDKDGFFSLAEFYAGRKVVDVKCYVSSPFGERLLLISHLVLEDGTKVRLAGEHDAVMVEDSYRDQERLQQFENP